MILNRDVWSKVIEYSLLEDYKSYHVLTKTCHFFHEICQDTHSKSAFLLSKYGEWMVYHETMAKHTYLFQIHVLECIHEMMNSNRKRTRLPRYLLKSLSEQHSDKNNVNNDSVQMIKMIDYLETKQGMIKECQDDLILKQFYLQLGEEARVSRRKSNFDDEIDQINNNQIKTVLKLRKFLQDSKFVPAMSIKRNLQSQLIDKFPLDLLEKDKILAQHLLRWSGFTMENINVAMSTKIYWEVEQFYAHETLQDRQKRIQIYMNVGGFYLGLDSIKELIRRTSWSDQKNELLVSMNDIEIVKQAAQEVILEYLESFSDQQYGDNNSNTEGNRQPTDESSIDFARYQCAVRVGFAYDIPMDFVQKNRKMCI